MSTIQIESNDLKRIVRDLKDAVDVCYTAPSKDGQGYPFATGYSRSAMQTVLQKLQNYLEE
jgi:hypothetical protein